MRVDVLSTAGIRAWGDMPATESDTGREKNGAENGVGSETGSKPRSSGATNGARVKDRARLGLEKVYWLLIE